MAGAVYDPLGDGNPDYKSYVDRAYDGNPDSAWLTWVYKQQFPTLKTGVGLMLHLHQQTTPRSVQITSATPGTTVETDRRPHRPPGSTRPPCSAPERSPTSR